MASTAPTVIDSRAPEILPTQPGALRGEMVLVLDTRQAQRLYEGRPAQRVEGKITKSAILGVEAFARRVEQVRTAAAADDPYADYCLVKLDEAFSKAEVELKARLEGIEIKLRARRGIEVAVGESIEPLRVVLRLPNQYGFKAAFLIADFDRAAAAILSGYHGALITRREGERLLALSRRCVRGALNVALRYRFSGASRADIEHHTARGQEAIERHGPLPEAILTRKQVPDFGAVHLVDGSPKLKLRAGEANRNAGPASASEGETEKPRRDSEAQLYEQVKDQVIQKCLDADPEDAQQAIRDKQLVAYLQSHVQALDEASAGVPEKLLVAVKAAVMAMSECDVEAMKVYEVLDPSQADVN